jgi:hypothetical protein
VNDFFTENSNKFQETRFWKEKSVEITLEGLSFNSSIISFDIWLFKKLIHYIAKQCSHVEFPYFVMGSHLGANSTGLHLKVKLLWFQVEMAYMNLRGT